MRNRSKSGSIVNYQREAAVVEIAEEVWALNCAGHKVDARIVMLLCLGSVKSKKAKKRIFGTLMPNLTKTSIPFRIKRYPWDAR